MTTTTTPAPASGVTTTTWQQRDGDRERAALWHDLEHWKAEAASLRRQRDGRDSRYAELNMAHVLACMDRDILANKLREETARHAATLEELRAVRAELAGSRKFGAMMRRQKDAAIDLWREELERSRPPVSPETAAQAGGVLRHMVEDCTCTLDLLGKRIPSHECPRHSRLERWVAVDGGDL